MHPATARAPCADRAHPGPHAGASAKPKLYNPRHPERTLRYRTIAEHFETWLELASAGQFDGQGDHHTPSAYVRQALRQGSRSVPALGHEDGLGQTGRQGGSSGFPYSRRDTAYLS